MIKESIERNEMWKWRDLIYMLVLVLVLVPIFIETVLFNYLLDFFQNELHAGTLNGFIMAIIFTTALYFIVLKPKEQSWKTVGLTPFPLRDWKLIAFWTIILIVVSIVLVIGMSFIGVGTENSKTESLQSQMTLLNFTIGFVSAAIISPIYEEIFYRGFLYRFFSSRYGVLSGMLISSLIFTVVHIPTYNTLPVNFVSGLIFSWVYHKTGSIIPSILIHGIFNGIAVILTAIA
ncbi:CAAX amino terminal protease self-immunity [Planococcus massiliensis]|uniref:CAAX amino terminal protease self-immunity n=1 Tax=Planococcus massiliensis TaxID=1499687 RepID=A0A098EG79_9BACL|nr:CAAX amino terminal protease self-immunity [Planococcus massiliensis]